MVVLIFDEHGLAGLKLPDDITAEQLLKYQELLAKIAPTLQALDEQIKQVSRNRNYVM